jgi:hypothetical protein
MHRTYVYLLYVCRPRGLQDKEVRVFEVTSEGMNRGEFDDFDIDVEPPPDLDGPGCCGNRWALKLWATVCGGMAVAVVIAEWC